MTQYSELFVIIEVHDKKAEVMGMIWLNNGNGKTRDIHYCMFKPAWGRCDDIVTDAVQQIFEYTGYECFIAVIGDNNKRAVDKPLNYGFTKIGMIPKYCWIHELQEAVPGHLYYITREN